MPLLNRELARALNNTLNDISGYFKLINYRRRFASVGSGLEIMGNPVFHGAGRIVAGKNLSLSSLVLPIEIFAQKGSVINIGNNVSINQGVTIGALQRVDIGDFTTVGDRTIIFDTDWQGLDGREPKTAPVRIGKHVLICARATVLKGVSVGDFSVIGAGSVVTRNVEKNTIVAGNPAKRIGFTNGYNYTPRRKQK
jgi:acetyltransferase-like isoleucine patch superfamily enzyme